MRDPAIDENVAMERNDGHRVAAVLPSPPPRWSGGAPLHGDGGTVRGQAQGAGKARNGLISSMVESCPF